jgi:hypothetical protein
LVFVGGGVIVGVTVVEPLLDKLPETDWLHDVVWDEVELGVAVLVGGEVTESVCVEEYDSVNDGVELAVFVSGGVRVRDREKDNDSVMEIVDEVVGVGGGVPDSDIELEKEADFVAVELCVGGGVLVSEAVLEKDTLWLHDVVSERPFDSVFVDDRVMVSVGVGSLRETDVVAVVELLCRKGPRG